MSIKLPDMGNSRILSVGSYRPKRLVPNSEIVDLIDSNDEWIQQRTGIQSRRFAGPDETIITMAQAASESALLRAKLTIADIDTVIVATITYPVQAPSAATDLVRVLGNPKIAAFDISAACAGFCYGVAMASDLVRAGTSKNVLVVGVEKLSDFLDPTDRGTAFIFGDGAGAVIVGGSVEPLIGPSVWGSDAESRDAISFSPDYTEFRNSPDKGVTELGWPYISQQGQTVYRWAVFTVGKIGIKALEAAGVRPDELGAFIPHQANMRIIESMAKEIKIPANVVIADDIRVNGNTSAASIPLAMDALLEKHPELHGQLALLIGYGAGLVYAAQVVQLPPKP